MCSDIVRSIGAAAEEAAVEAAWAQWAAITSVAVPAGQPRVWAIVDPEALILVSIAVRHRERRLDDLLAGWARTGSSLVSIQRLKALAKHFPTQVQEQVGYFARHAADAGDRRWLAHASDGGAEGFVDRGKELGPPRLLDGPGLMLRLRAGIGVGAKADLLTYLLGIQGASADLRALTVATGYSDRALRTAADEMALARFIRTVPGTPSAYRADPDAWMPLTGAGSGDVPPWRFWSLAFAFLAAVGAWEREASLHGWSCYVASSRARDLMELHGPRMRYLSAQLDSGSEARGAEYLDVFMRTVQRMALWAREHLYQPHRANA